MDRRLLREYFSTAVERQQIYLERQAGYDPPWTEDPIFAEYKFCNVFREQDRNTIWFRQHVREPMRRDPNVLLATLIFRLFNRISSAEALFLQPNLDGETAFEKLLRTGSTEHMVRTVQNWHGRRGPHVTGAYIIKTPEGMTKLDGVVYIIDRFYHNKWSERALAPLQYRWQRMAHSWLSDSTPWTLSEAAGWLERAFFFIGHFTAYEIVSDLRHTDLLCRAPDIHSWANPGPGATRGLNLIHGRPPTASPAKRQLVEEMREILALSRSGEYWPTSWPRWEMREVEHWLCEYYKYHRFANGGARPRQRFRV